MVFGSKKSKKKEEEMGFIEDLESIKGDILGPGLPGPSIEPPKEPLQLQPLPSPTRQPPMGQPISSELTQLPPPMPQNLQVQQQVQTVESRSFAEREAPEIYVKLDNYKKVLDLLEKLKVKLREIESLVSELKSIKESEVSKLEEIKDRLERSKEDIGEVLENLK